MTDLTSEVDWTVCTLRQPRDGERLELGADFNGLTRKYGQRGVIQGWDHRGGGLLEVHQLDFANLPKMDAPDHALLMRLIHTPTYVMIHAAGQKVSVPVTGHWVRSGEPEHARLSQLPRLGEVTR